MDTVMLAFFDIFHTVNQGRQEGGRGQIAAEHQGPRGLITPNASRFGGSQNEPALIFRS